MTVPVSDHRVLLQPTDLEPLGGDRTIVGVFNPAATRFNDGIVLLARVDESPMPGGPDTLSLPRIDCAGGDPNWVVDIFPSNGADTSDPREFRLSDGSMRLPHLAHLRVVRLSPDGMTVLGVSVVPDLLPREPWEELGIEDPRITLIGDTYYVTYVAISRHMGIVTALMTTHDFERFTRHGIIFASENKDVVLLPGPLDGGFTAYHRPVSCSGVSAPSILSARSPDGVHWGRHRLLLSPRPGMWDCVKVGAGPPPIRVPEGWLLIYHGVDKAGAASPVGMYRAGAALIDADDPSRILSRSQGPMIEPHHPHETKGLVPNVVFPTGLVPADAGDMLVFGGAADEVTTVTRISVQSVLDHLKVEAT